MIVFGLEGTAWNLSAALVDEEGVLYEKSATYTPARGGIHPREAAQHHAEHMAEVVGDVMGYARDQGLKVDAVAFSQGPGLGPCLRTVATAARALSLRFRLPLVGVNHCVAHIEVGKWQSGAGDPAVIYVSGANSQVLALRKGRYRIFGETLDISVGNAIDKFARSVGLPHPGGPKVEELARQAHSYIPLPYTVKGMDLSFSGLSTAASEAARRYDLADVCYSLQETAFAMLVEVTERAMAHAAKKEAMLVGGVGANKRLGEMLNIMCEERGAKFFLPPRKFMGDNGSMIAYTGLLMWRSGSVTPIEESKVRPGYRTDDVPVTWA
ncbi:MAG TPA: bifunctional N(6)-L-threonylcarbamoyladenine synthase/serine/threonine protein kinase [Methanothrix sp.]|jgi:universal protein Kae1|nr:bifunctional N(6)-L-threonylcarbamoyladenine synthase/serine/threonine protein kinase [Methanothrix sp.]HOV82015.1 bifunctional N(6)-L-threonylcarbamoyladenine synthase/serine/threonine protein kinase [Methanothrix sp.]HPC90430.1 bifunctional N(6)-L-threonylcarbamoyladenine synthase/serine/threonine protein kinase [Methanothrix sp.]HQE88430.1 bifunctional N(6)-L-threonylcarbamoyladenine synthase/serine/threonine protein kinase [Methanothrix sp.]HQI68684.1 bifunctional N(6)-L-threonylcarbamoy